MYNDINKLYPILIDFNKTLNFYGLANLNQIFSESPEVIKGHVGKEMNFKKLQYSLIGEGASINPRVSTNKDWFVYGFMYPNSKLKNKLGYSFEPGKLWIGIKSVVIVSEKSNDIKTNKNIKSTNRKKIINNISAVKQLRFDSLESTPIYIKTFFEIARKYHRSCYVVILDDLPNNIIYLYSPHLNLKHHKEPVLKHILYAISENDDEEFLNNTLIKLKIANKSFEESIDSIIKETGINSVANYNLCLACGTKIDIDKVFCYEKRSYRKKGSRYTANPDNCRNKHRYRQRDRLGIIDPDEQKENTQYLAKELKGYVITSPFGAFERFKKKYPNLYERKKMINR